MYYLLLIGYDQLRIIQSYTATVKRWSLSLAHSVAVVCGFYNIYIIIKINKSSIKAFDIYNYVLQ